MNYNNAIEHLEKKGRQMRPDMDDRERKEGWMRLTIWCRVLRDDLPRNRRRQ